MIYLLIFSISFLGTYYVMPHSIRKLRENNYIVRDMYKYHETHVPTNAGTIVLFTSFISIALIPLFIRVFNLVTNIDSQITDLNETNLAFLLVISIYAIYGLVDDLVDIGRKLKLLLPVVFSYPLIGVINPEIIWLPIIGNFDLSNLFLGQISWNDLFKVFIIPIYIMVVSNLVNMHSGYNGLQSGLSIIILSTLIAHSLILENIKNIYPSIAFLGSMFAFWFFNKYPSKVFEGNIGSLLFGSVIGCIIVIQQFWWFGFFILIPHTFNFILWIIWLILIRKDPANYLEKDGKHKKFGEVSKEGYLKVPNLLTLKWIPNYFYKLDEKNSVYIQYILTLVFCLSGLILF